MKHKGCYFRGIWFRDRYFKCRRYPTFRKQVTISGRLCVLNVTRSIGSKFKVNEARGKYNKKF